jgi:hypothetical protein
MKKILYSLVVLAIVVSSCGKRIKPSANITKIEKPYSNFTTIDASNAFDVVVYLTDSVEKVEVEANENLQSYITLEQVGNTLKVKMEDGIDINGEATTRLNVWIPSLQGIKGSGASSFLILNTLESELLGVELSGASSFEGQLNVVTVNANLSGASQFKASGTVQTFTGDASGASQFGSFNLVLKDLILELSGASLAEFTVTETISVKASGASNLYYKGNATVVSQDLSGASNLEQVN